MLMKKDAVTAEELDVIIPVSLELDWPTKESVVKDILYQYKNYGFKKFALAVPSGGWRSIGYPPREFYIERAELFAKIRTELEAYGIKCGWWITATLSIGKNDEFQPIVQDDGNEAPYSPCPLDDKYKKRFSEDVAIFSKIAKPDFIITEDDLSMSAAHGCFCQKHLDEFAKRCGTYYSREEILNKISQHTDESYELLRKWSELKRDTLVWFAEAIRKELDKESPEIPIGNNQSGYTETDGDVTEAISKAMAGPRHTPFSRLHGTFYCGVNSREIPERLFHALYDRQHIKGDFKFYHESDTYPHTRFFTAGKHMKAMMATAYSYAFDGSLFQTQQLLDDPNEERSYGTMFAKERLRFNMVRQIAKNCEIKGVELPWDRFWNNFAPSFATGNPLWIKCISRFGIPYTSLKSNVAFWDARQTRYYDDEAILDGLSKNLFLDGDAAKTLCERGFGKYIGVSIGREVNENKNIRYDLAAREVICDKFADDGKGRNMPSAHMYAPSGNGKWFEMSITDEKCEVISEAYTCRKELITPTMTRFENELGGKVVVMNLTLNGNGSHALLNYRRQRLIQKLITWCSDEYVYVKENPDVSIIVNEPKNDDADFIGMLTLINLSEDDLCSSELHLPPKWQKANKFLCLNREGEWKEVEFNKTSDGIELLTEFKYCEPVYVKALK